MKTVLWNCKAAGSFDDLTRQRYCLPYVYKYFMGTFLAFLDITSWSLQTVSRDTYIKIISILFVWIWISITADICANSNIYLNFRQCLHTVGWIFIIQRGWSLNRKCFDIYTTVTRMVYVISPTIGEVCGHW